MGIDKRSDYKRERRKNCVNRENQLYYQLYTILLDTESATCGLSQ